MRLPPCESNGYKLNSCRVVHAFGVRSRNTTWQHLASLSLREFCRPYLLRPFLLTPLPKSTNNGTTFDQKRDQSGLRGGGNWYASINHIFLFLVQKANEKNRIRKINIVWNAWRCFKKWRAQRLCVYCRIMKFLNKNVIWNISQRKTDKTELLRSRKTCLEQKPSTPRKFHATHDLSMDSWWQNGKPEMVKKGSRLVLVTKYGFSGNCEI